MKNRNKKLHYFDAIRFLARYMKEYQKNFIMFYVGWLADSVLAIILPILFGIMIDEVVYYRNLDSFVKVALVFLACILFSGGLYFLLYAQHGYLMNMFVFSVRRDVFKHLQKCEAEYLTGVSTGEILAVLQEYPSECMHFIIRNMIHLYNGILMAFLYGIYLVIIDWRIGLVALLAAALSLSVNTNFKERIGTLGRKERKAYGEYVGWMYEAITALLEIRMLGGQEKVKKRLEEKQKAIFHIGIKISISSLTSRNIVNFTGLAIRLVIYGISAGLAAGGNITLGTLTVIFSFYDKLSGKISQISQNVLDAQRRISYIQSIYGFLLTKEEPEKTAKLHIEKGEVAFCGLSFGYENCEELLINITFTVQPGEHVAIVGKSGCGKTTLAYLLIGFYRAKEGFIAIDKQKLETCSLKSVRGSIGYVQQDVLVFDGSIRENLLLGNLRATKEQILQAYRAAGLGPFIDSLPQGADTVIGSRGIGLSGGQKQRIAIARIYLKNPKIVIFDEATSALDSETEEEIHRAWKKALAGKTAIIISHRQSSVMLCDRVVVLEHGQIVESGIPEKMARESERFQTLFAIPKEGSC